MRSRLFEDDPLTGTRKIWHYDETTDRATIETLYDIDGTHGLKEQNLRQSNTFDERSRWAEGVGDRVASIPTNVWADLEARGIANDDKALLKWLDDRDNLVFRTRPGKLSK